jgi:hypothetical protein
VQCTRMGRCVAPLQASSHAVAVVAESYVLAADLSRKRAAPPDKQQPYPL